MRFLVDECVGPLVASWIREQGHDVYSVYDHSRGIDDESLIRKAHEEDRIIVTTDKDFGEKVFREQLPHKGIILLRLQDERSANKIAVIDRLFTTYQNELSEKFVVASENKIRFSRSPN